MENIKNEFPIFEKYPHLAYLDNGATTLKPKRVLDEMMKYYTEYSANIHRGVYRISEIATAEYDKAREDVANFLGVIDKSEIIFTRGTTESLNMVAMGWGANEIGKDDEILVSQMEHHANLLPWQRLAHATGAKLKYIPLTSDWEIDLDQLKQLINKRTRVLAITHTSNVLGVVNPIKEIIGIARGLNPNIVVVIDGAQAIAHTKVDVGDLDCDFYAFSGHKAYGPTGIGVLWGRKELLEKIEPIYVGGGMIKAVTWENVTYAELPDRLEAGTPPIAQAIGLASALRWICEKDIEKIKTDESKLLNFAWDKLSKIEGVQLLGTKNLEKRSGIISFTIHGIHAHDVASILDRFQVCVRSGHHCTMPLHQLMGVDASVRMSLGIYNDVTDIDKLIEGLIEAKRIFNHG